MIKALVTEYGVPWLVNRSLYSAKLKMMRTIQSTESIFEKQVNVKRIDIFDINKVAIENFINNLSDEKKKGIIHIADRAIEGKIKGFSSIELDYGNPINWHYSPLTKKEVDKTLKWYQIPDFDPERGDIKAIWEASRFTHFFYFIRAFMITKNPKYYRAFSDQLSSWLTENQYSYGPNYKCGQEATLRMINVLIAYSSFKSYGLTTNGDVKNVHLLVDGSYRKVLSNFFYAHKCIKNNHTLSEITGLIIGAWACEDEKRLEHAYQLLDKEIENQFYNDGGYIQYSFNYQRFALQIMEFVLKISNRTNRNISSKSKELIKNSAYLMYQMQDETGDLPNYGSNDGALIFPVTSCSYRDFRPIINTIYYLIDGKRIFEYGDYDEEILWFGDGELEKIPQQVIHRESSSFSESGFYSLRFENGFLMTVLQNYKSRPAQMDQLHLDLWHKGVNVFCDSGTYSYATETGKKMSLTSAHNTVSLDTKEQMNKYGPFLIYDWTKKADVSHTKDSFSGIMESKNGYSHQRKIERNKNGFLVQDKVFGEGGYCYYYFHTPCEVVITSKGFELYHDGKIICNVVAKGLIEVEESYRSLYYLKKVKVNCVVVKKKMIENRDNSNFIIELK